MVKERSSFASGSFFLYKHSNPGLSFAVVKSFQKTKEMLTIFVRYDIIKPVTTQTERKNSIRMKMT